MLLSVICCYQFVPRCNGLTLYMLIFRPGIDHNCLIFLVYFMLTIQILTDIWQAVWGLWIMTCTLFNFYVTFHFSDQTLWKWDGNGECYNQVFWTKHHTWPMSRSGGDSICGQLHNTLSVAEKYYIQNSSKYESKESWPLLDRLIFVTVGLAHGKDVSGDAAGWTT